MAVTITRSVWIDDDGTGQTGTVINQALHTTLYNEIDTALAKVAQLAGGNTFTGNQTITGLLTVTGSGAHTVTGTVAGGTLSLGVQNLSASNGSTSTIYVGNNTSATLAFVETYASGASANSYINPSGTAVVQTGTGGLAVAAVNAGGAFRVFTGGFTERMQIAPTGQLLVNTTVVLDAAIVGLRADNTAGQRGIAIQSLGAALTYLDFLNSASGVAGSVVQTAATTVAYNTTSDARLKTDEGRATDLAALRAVVVHDFRWTADGVRARGVFAQEAAAVFPAAITEGADDVTDDGSLARPWMTDYSKFVPDLIVGWQQHDADLAAIRDLLATLKG